MIQLFRAVLSREDLDRVRGMLEGAVFVEGSETATGSAASIKRNLQLGADSEAGRRAGEHILRALMCDRRIKDAVLPRSGRHPIIARYEPGMEYGEHLDHPLMLGGVATRIDVSCTVFLSDRAAYEGGDLVIDTDGAPVPMKGDAGDVVIYPGGSMHRVEPVTGGARLVAVTWFQSLVRDPAKRRILYDLSLALGEMEAGPAADRVRRSYNNLLRLWAET